MGHDEVVQERRVLLPYFVLLIDDTLLDCLVVGWEGGRREGGRKEGGRAGEREGGWGGRREGGRKEDNSGVVRLASCLQLTLLRSSCSSGHCSYCCLPRVTSTVELPYLQP